LRYFKINLWICAFGFLFLITINTIGYAYQNVNGKENCYSCHTDFHGNTDWHKRHSIYTFFVCTICHQEAAAGDSNVPSNSCSNCHMNLPCNWVNAHETNPAFDGSCLSCHTACETNNGDCATEVILGNDDPMLVTLRQFRDEVLARNAAGKAVIRLYYKIGEPLAKMCESHPTCKAYAKHILETIMPVIEVFLSDEDMRHSPLR
jgi:hypothetical protein